MDQALRQQTSLRKQRPRQHDRMDDKMDMIQGQDQKDPWTI